MASNDLVLVDLLRAARAEEALACAGSYSVALEAKFKLLLQDSAFFPLKLLWGCFENTPVWLYRCGKVESARTFARKVEKFVVDMGERGNNGKTFQQWLMELILGDYMSQVKEAILVHDPPIGCDSSTLSLRGQRGLAAPEVTEKPIKSAWLKKLSDPATRWKARAPYRRVA